MASHQRHLSFCWWNLHNFAHFDPDRIALKGWPKQRVHYEEKRERVVAALQDIFKSGCPDLIATCEITREAARDLAERLPGDYSFLVSPKRPRDRGFSVAIFFRNGMAFTPEDPLVPSEDLDLVASTRAMLPVHFTYKATGTHVIRIVACHWTAFGTRRSREARQRLADFLRRNTYDFLNPKSSKADVKHYVLILGDLNEEPSSEIFESRLIGTRDRASTRVRHPTDREVHRVRLYNAAWRFLGERLPHGTGASKLGAAGTYYNKSKWRTFDQVFVSSGLVGDNPPYFDEVHTEIAVTERMLDRNGRPTPFKPGTPYGISDHLPIVGRLVLWDDSK